MEKHLVVSDEDVAALDFADDTGEKRVTIISEKSQE